MSFFGFFKSAPMPVVAQVDLKRMQGAWIEIARMPIMAQSNDEYCWQDHYEMQNDGSMVVTGSYRKGSLTGPWQHMKGKITIPDPTVPAKWSTQFVWPFSAHQWIVDLDANYQWVFFGHPNRRWLWIMAREGKIDPAVKTSLVEKAKELGYDTEKLIYDTPCTDVAPRD